MKKIILAMALMLQVSAFCAIRDDLEYKVDFKGNKRFLNFSVETSKDQSSMGELVITALLITSPQKTKTGMIAINLGLDPDSAHLMAIGPQKGSFKFFRGDRLPQIKDGMYEIIINDTSYGHMLIDQKEGEYFPLEKSYQ